MKSWRRRISGLLILVTGLLLLLGGYYGVKSHRYNRALARLQILDGEITTYLIEPSWTPTGLPGSQNLSIETEQMELIIENSRLDNADLGFLKDLAHLWVLNLWGESVNDQVLLAIPQLDSLRGLDLSDTNVSVEGLQEVLKMTPNLIYLGLAGTKLQDDDLKVLKTLPKLIFVNLSRTQVTEARLKHLQGLSSIETLYLDGTSITPAELKILRDFPKLQSLSLKGVEIHDSDVQVFVGMKNLDCIFLEEGQLPSEVLLRLKNEMPELHVILLEPST